MDENKKLKEALKVLYEWTVRLCECAGHDIEYANKFWEKLKANTDILREYAYYYDNREFLCEFKVGRFTVADILVWQMDHFRAHLDRGDSVNRYDKDRLLLSTFETLIELKENPEYIMEQYAAETGIDLAEGWNIH